MSERHSFINEVTSLLNWITVFECWKNNFLIFLCYSQCDDYYVHTFKFDRLIIAFTFLTKHWQTFSVKGQQVNILGFVGHICYLSHILVCLFYNLFKNVKSPDLQPLPVSMV